MWTIIWELKKSVCDFYQGIDYTEMIPESSLVTIVNKLILVPLACVLGRIAMAQDEHQKQQHMGFCCERRQFWRGFACLACLGLMLVNF